MSCCDALVMLSPIAARGQESACSALHNPARTARSTGVWWHVQPFVPASSLQLVVYLHDVEMLQLLQARAWLAAGTWCSRASAGCDYNQRSEEKFVNVCGKRFPSWKEIKYIFYRLETPPFTQPACCLEPSLVLSFNGGKNNAVSCHSAGKMFELAPGKWLPSPAIPMLQGAPQKEWGIRGPCYHSEPAAKCCGESYWENGGVLQEKWSFCEFFHFYRWNVSSICKQAGSMAVQKLLHQLLLLMFVSVLQELRTRVRTKQSEFLLSSKQEVWSS